MTKPTNKQILFIEKICDTLDLEYPDCKTIKEASDFIQDYIDDYYDTLENIRDNEGLFANGIYDND